jgi:O-antigen/teichoic acid export membrane protein
VKLDGDVEPASESAGMAAQAVHGTGWTVVSGVINKLATLVSTLVVAHYLGPDDYALSSVALAIGGFVLVLPPLVMGDVIVSHARDMSIVADIARRISYFAATVSVITIVLAIPVFLGVYSKFPGGSLAALLMVFALRPIGDASAVIPLSTLRVGMQYRKIAAIDGSVQLVATATTIAMAAFGAGALALVMPQASASVIKAVLYKLYAGPKSAHVRTRRLTASRNRLWTQRLRRQFVIAALAQYVHTLVGNLPILVLGRWASAGDTGNYTFAFLLSIQATSIVSLPIAIVLQPIFVKLGSDVSRQAAGFIRVLSTISAIAVPVSLLQGALADPLFAILFDAKWQGAVLVFQILSIGQAFFFAVAPIMSMMRARKYFGTLLWWQTAQLVSSFGIYAWCATHAGSVGVAVADVLLWLVSVPVAAWLCTRQARMSLRRVVWSLGAPWLTALPIAIAAWGLGQLLEQFGNTGAWLAIGVVGPLCLAISFLAARISQPLVYAEVKPIVFQAINGLIRRLQSSFGFHRNRIDLPAD